MCVYLFQPQTCTSDVGIGLVSLFLILDCSTDQARRIQTMSSMRRSLDVSSALSSDDLAEYDIISEGQRSLESSIADLGLVDRIAPEVYEPAPSEVARARFMTPSLTPEDIQAYVRRELNPSGRLLVSEMSRTVRVYVDGQFDPVSTG